MTHHEGFLAAILAEPERDDVRLIYADWLEDNGDPDRAEFIRVQCTIARDPFAHNPPPFNPHCACNLCTLRRRERDLLDNVGRGSKPNNVWRFLGDASWVPGTPSASVCGTQVQLYHGSPDKPGTHTVTFRRGFMAEVTLPCGQWMRHGPALVRAAPLQVVTLSDLHPSPRPPWHDWYPPWAHDMALAHHDVPAAVLPEPLWNALDWPTFDGKGPHGPAMRGYPSESVALDALSRACLTWARKPVPAAH